MAEIHRDVEATKQCVTSVFLISLCYVTNIGNIIYLSVLNNHIIVLQKRQDAIEILEKRSGIYSDRPQIPIFESYISLLSGFFLLSPILSFFLAASGSRSVPLQSLTAKSGNDNEKYCKSA